MALSNFTYKNEENEEKEKQNKNVRIMQNEPIPDGMQVPETVESELFVPGFLMTQIGKYMRIDFLIGNSLTDRTGRLERVGASYIILRALDGNMVLCDMFSIKFAEIVESPTIVV